ncbi:OmpL47-type beta-barrel domain-containing protein [Paenibacillus humicola]|uniref:OmpL47-type beta-barrel domain-containing protein n=1 Tax=Paenibacillus humicola TaxID=3110540 RepID=UPI00237BDEB9|nr:fibronectin type III domain-containing protein [Paenibacillus humicola]
MKKRYNKPAWLPLLLALIIPLQFVQPKSVSAAPAAPPVMLQDDFSDGDYTANPVWTVASGTWTVAADPADSGNKVLRQTDTGEGIITAGDPAWTDSSISMRFNTGDGGGYPGILARVQDDKDFYYFQMQATGTLVLSKRIDGTDTVIKSAAYPMSKNTWYTLKMVLVGSSIKCYIVSGGTDKLVFDAADTTYAGGKIGIRNKWQAIQADDVTVAGAPPANASAVRSDAQTGSSIALQWDPADGASSYNVYRSTTPGSGYAFVANTTDTGFTDTGLTSDTAYYYKVAYLYGGLTESQWSSELSVRTKQVPPGAPTGQTAAAIDSSSVGLSWTAVPKATGYRVYRSADAGQTFAKVYDGTATSCTDTGLAPAAAYRYNITAYNPSGESPAAAAQATTYRYDAPANFKAASTTASSAALTWDPVKGTAVSYKVSRSSSADGTYVQLYSGTDTSFTDTGLTQGTGYFYTLSAVIDGTATAVSKPLGVGTVRTAYTPDQIWADTSGNPIDAHGAGFLYDPKTKKYYWYGEYHKGAWPSSGVRVYSSTDLLNWKDEGMALTMVKSMDDFTNDPLISKLYAGRTDTVDIWADIRLGRIIERPKVIYNDKTKKYVMWAHIDGDKDPYNDNANYGKAQAGYALSDSPTGPFVYQKSYRMDQCPPDQTDYQPGNPGMARDMNLFKDDDGTAYLIYSSEENRTIYISKLTDDYTDVTGWHKDGRVDANGNPVRDSTYKGVYGVDYIRVYPGGTREAPAVFKYNGNYYLLTSSATGWSPNENMVSVSSSMLGQWSPQVDPFVRTSPSDPNPLTSFNSQTASVLPVDPAKGKFIYVGDDWNGGNFSANGGAKYIWLPIEFGQGSDMTIKWYDSWTKDLLDHMGSVSTNVKLPEVITTGTALSLPQQIEVTPSGAAEAITTPVSWTVDAQPVTADTFAQPGPYTLQATLPAFNNKTLNFKLYAIPDKTVYFVNSGGYATSDYTLMTAYMQDTLINKDAVEQPYNPADAVPWGYTGTNSNPAGSTSGDIFNTLRYLNGGNVVHSPAGTDLTYKFTVRNGTYTVYTGFNDIWSNSTRKADLYINGAKKNAITFISDKVYANTVDVTDGTINVTVRNTAAQDPLINWIMIVDPAQTRDHAMGLKAVPSGAGSAAITWNKTPGALTYTLYRAAGPDGTYSPVYSGSEAEFHDTGLDPEVTYYYKVSSTGLSSPESPVSEPVTLEFDHTKPVTTLALTGTAGSGGWYTSEVTAALTASDDSSGVAKTEYRLGDSGDWTVYSEPIKLADDGLYTLQFRSTDQAGNVEDAKTSAVKVDKTAPAFKLFADGRELQAGDSISDDQPVTFEVYDNLSGVVSGQISVSDLVYAIDPAKGPSVTIDMAGMPGTHAVAVQAADAAGNKLQSGLQLNVTTSIDSIEALLGRYRAELREPLAQQLGSNLAQARHQLELGRPDQAAKMMGDFAKHLNNGALGTDGDEHAKAVLNADALALIAQWSGVS